MSHLGQRISALIDGELSDAERDRVLAHIAGCDPCRQEAVALRALKQRMHSLGEAMVDADLTGRLMAMATPPDGHPWSARTPWRSRSGFPAARMLTAGLLASTVAGLGAAAFFAGGDQPIPGPRVTPAVDTFLVQHAIVTGDLPVTPATSGTAGHSGAPAAGHGSVPAGVSAGVSASAVTGAAAAGVRAVTRRPARIQAARGQAASGQSSAGQAALGQAARGQATNGEATSGEATSEVGSMVLGSLRQPVAAASSPVPAATATASAFASPGP